MASRNELLIIRAARAGQASAQLALGRRYLFGGNGLPRSPKTALYWLDRAASQQQADAWMLIGRHVPFEIASEATRPSSLSIWYERAYDAGLAEAGLVYARLVLQQNMSLPAPGARRKALTALETAAHAGIADAQWLLAQQLGNAAESSRADSSRLASSAALLWATRAAEAGLPAARRALAEHGWASGDDAFFLRWALPLAREIVKGVETSEFMARQLAEADVVLLSRCAQALLRQPGMLSQEIVQFLELAAWARDRDAQYYLGLWFAKLDIDAVRLAGQARSAQYKKAIRWLTLAARQGHPEAWFALSRIYLKPECSQRNLADARTHLRRAAEAGHTGAQAEFGIFLWRTRRDRTNQDVEAAGWLQKAAAQGHEAACSLLKKVAGPAMPGAWAIAARNALTRELSLVQPFLAARLELAALFGLNRAEALLLDVSACDRGHCLLIDIRAARPRSRRRLILLDTAAKRQALERIARLFENVDCGVQGPEGSYRQRLYRLNSLLV
jgi:TPR repeat protein